MNEPTDYWTAQGMSKELDERIKISEIVEDKCPHGQIKYYYDAYSYHESETEDGDHTQPLPPYCRCCGGPCTLGWNYCVPCGGEARKPL